MKWFRFSSQKSPQPDIGALIQAIEAEELEQAKALLHQAPDLLEASNQMGIYPLLGALLLESVPLVQLLLEKGAQPNRTDVHGGSLLMYAIQRQLEEIVSLFLQYGADPHQRDSEGDTPLMYAAAGRSSNIVLALLEAGAKPHDRNFDGLTALDKAFHPPIQEVLDQKQP